MCCMGLAARICSMEALVVTPFTVGSDQDVLEINTSQVLPSSAMLDIYYDNLESTNVARNRTDSLSEVDKVFDVEETQIKGANLPRTVSFTTNATNPHKLC